MWNSHKVFSIMHIFHEDCSHTGCSLSETGGNLLSKVDQFSKKIRKQECCLNASLALLDPAFLETFMRLLSGKRLFVIYPNSEAGSIIVHLSHLPRKWPYISFYFSDSDFCLMKNKTMNNHHHGMRNVHAARGKMGLRKQDFPLKFTRNPKICHRQSAVNNIRTSFSTGNVLNLNFLNIKRFHPVKTLELKESLKKRQMC